MFFLIIVLIGVGIAAFINEEQGRSFGFFRIILSIGLCIAIPWLAPVIIILFLIFNFNRI